MQRIRTFGTCSAAITLFANGQRLERFPVKVPIGLYPERASLFPALIELFERVPRPLPTTFFARAEFSCSN